jgi:hypothetical protein
VIRRGHDVDDARWNVGLLGDDPAEIRRAPGRVGSRLEHDRIARGQRRPELGEVQIEGEVPGRDRSDHAHGLAPQQPRLGLAHERDVVHRPLVGVAAGELRPIGHGIEVDVDLGLVGDQDR